MSKVIDFSFKCNKKKKEKFIHNEFFKQMPEKIKKRKCFQISKHRQS